ncbi:MAG: MMPL family transporter [Thermoleophilia bacterium]|nr:MMPL family transporter [Thermoleophilia bacterium]
MFSAITSPAAWARRSATHPRRVIAVWGVVVIASLAIVATLLGSALTSSMNFIGSPESKRADQAITAQIGVRDAVTETVAITRAGATAAQLRPTVERLAGQIRALGPSVVEGVATPWSAGGNAGLLSRNGQTGLISVRMAGSTAEAQDHIGPILALARSAEGSSGATVRVTGQASIAEDVNTAAEKDLKTGEAIGIPVALLVLLLVFGTLVSALLPIGLAVVAILVSLALTALVGQVFELSFFVTNMITMMGLAVGIDYVLFIVSRYREERAAGREKLDAIEQAGQTASRAVLFSGLTVVVALVGLLIVPTTIFVSLATGAILVVLCALAAAHTLLPATLSLLGDRIDAGRVSRLLPARLRPRRTTGFWPRAVRGVMRRPIVSVVVVVAALGLAAVPYLDLRPGAAGVESMPSGLQSRQGFELLQREFSVGGIAPARIPLLGDPSSAANRRQIATITSRVAERPIFGTPVLEPGATARGAVLDVPINADASSPAATAAVRELRTYTTLPVGGTTSQNIDYFDISSRYLPIVVGIVLALSFLVLLVAFRSIVVPLLAIAMNLLSVGAAYGLLTLVSQKGYGAGLLGFQRVSTIEAWLPLFLFAVLFGLSMDYQVFLLSRIRERFIATGDTASAIVEGISSSARLITGAALIMVVVFAGFASGQLVMFQQMGFGLAVAILIDATLVRTVLVPAAMRLLGDRNWYLPKHIAWLARFSPDSPTPARAEAREA